MAYYSNPEESPGYGQPSQQQAKPQQNRPGIDTGRQQGSWGGFNVESAPTSGTSLGQPAFAGEQGVGSEAQFILQGSSGAEAALRRGYEMMLREQAGNVASASQENSRRSRAALTAGGVSPMLASLVTGQRDQEAQGQYGGAVAGAGADLQTNLATLEKGTGSELASARQYDLGLLLKAKMGRDAAVAAEPSGLSQLANVGLGAASVASGLGWKPLAA